MSSIRSYGRRAGSLFAVAALTLATITPGLIPSFASAAQLTERSVEVTSAVKSGTGTNGTAVGYTIKFTPVDAADIVVLDFCSNSALIGASCTAPTGFSASAATSSSGTVTSPAANTAKVTLTTELDDDVENSVVLGNITNPSVTGPLYVRIVTYTTEQDTADAYASATDLGATHTDDGGAAVLITDAINVSGAVLESLSFCVAGPTADTQNPGEFLPTTIGDNCTGTLPAPTLRLGERAGTAYALSSSAVSEGNLYTQISTNAVSGAVVNLKSSAAGCGGLVRVGPTNCDIAPAQATNITNGQAKFGLKTNAPTVTGDDLINPVGNYNTSTFALNYDEDEDTGVTSPYGDPVFNTNSAPISNGNLTLTFGASVAPSTPAGLYSASLSLIATGKF